ncbi:flagellar FliL protein [Pseudomonas sp. ok272]|uniref:flagellar basal body-associated FliL family protein n=1 Tax=unclassified Pseudomonas TaxID=196821 RepID=UPI0008CB22B6|nr:MULTISPECIES: flagellar basal body-associated FliL family protein [unclassified Pseudomonas]SEM63111.1 flagellar FliL protein [Pseudomonas sp. ok272]SFM46958.1 flagellar FliL protein [Pseudomonas sp. ok602]
MSMPRVILLMLMLNIAITLAGFTFTYSQIKARPMAAVSTVESDASTGSAQAEEEVELTEYTFFPIEKIIVSLQGEGREYYVVLDLVLQAEAKADVKKLEQIDPMVRTSVVALLSSKSLREVRAMSVPELQAVLEKALLADFASKKLVLPFAHVLVSKLIVQ